MDLTFVGSAVGLVDVLVAAYMVDFEGEADEAAPVEAEVEEGEAEDEGRGRSGIQGAVRAW